MSIEYDQRSAVDISNFTRSESLAQQIRMSRQPLRVDDITRNPAAPELFQLVRASARRASQTLKDIALAIPEGKFDRNTHIFVKGQVERQLSTDPVFRLADSYWEINSGQRLPLVSTEPDGERELTTDDVFVFDEIPYQGSTGRMLRLLNGTTNQYPLSIASLASIVYPTDILFPRTLTKTKSSLKNIRNRYMTDHPRYQLTSVQTGDNMKERKYYIRPSASVTYEETVKPTLNLAVHSSNEYIKIGDTIVNIDPFIAIPQNANDAINLLKYLALRQGKWVSSSTIHEDLFNGMNLTSEQKMSRMRAVKAWLKKYVTYNGEPIIRRSQKGTSGSFYGIVDYSVDLSLSDVPFTRLPKSGGTEVITAGTQYPHIIYY